ncbi:GFA family protein [Rhodobacter sp. NTK016B]|uniref:GFA family protein n=1 Tax=Rhodobacter sp. NTK016B TaxID=2759676 RepID=UPI001A8E1AD0|nr:GFA family protein [Rhodobacter sp. NTK016B]MBN8292925.1 GFA family protein [Rhodobacter sp. NTK016B]
MSEFHEGGCACGAVRYRVSGAPDKAAICHCRYCQLRTGSAFGISVYFPDEAVELVSGDLKEYSFQTESDRRFSQRFCTQCGTTVLWSLEVFPGLTGIAGGTFDPPTFWYDIRREVFARSRAPFLAPNADIASFDTSSSHNPVIVEQPSRLGGPGL